MSTNAERARLIAQATQQSLQDLYRLDAEVLTELERLYREVLVQVEERLQRYSSAGYFNTAYYQHYVEQIKVLVAQLAKARVALLNDSLPQAARLGAEPVVVIGGVVNTAIAHSVQAAWQYQAADGLQLSERIWRLDRLAKETLSAPIRQALASGENPLKAARAFLENGQGIPPDVLEKMQGLATGHLQQAISEQFLTGKGSALYNAQRLFQSEMTRAHGVAYVASNNEIEGLVGYRFHLSPLHRRTDICDTLATADSYGLGAGVYPKGVILSKYPAHPNTRSYITAVYD